MKNLIIRTITGVLFIAVIIFSVISNPLVLFNIFFIFACIGLYEYKSLLKIKNIELGIPFYIVAIIVYILIGYAPLWEHTTAKKIIPFALLISLSVFSLIALFQEKEKSALAYIASSIGGIVFIAIPFALINHFVWINKGKILLLSVFILIWAYDTLAYCIGSLIGKHPFSPRISPKKTWEGAIGSALATLIISYFFIYIFPSISELHSISSFKWMGLASIIIVTGTLGDLVESMFKRALNVKDTGYILPGHGGILDRFDSLLFAIPFVLFYLFIII